LRAAVDVLCVGHNRQLLTDDRVRAVP